MLGSGAELAVADPAGKGFPVGPRQGENTPCLVLAVPDAYTPIWKTSHFNAVAIVAV
jgi:hypothetical protein